MSTTTTEVKVGQVWADNDFRAAGRTLRVVGVSEGRAECVVLTEREDFDPRYSRPAVGRCVRIRLDRFRPTSTGYRLLEDAS